MTTAPKPKEPKELPIAGECPSSFVKTNKSPTAYITTFSYTRLSLQKDTTLKPSTFMSHFKTCILNIIQQVCYSCWIIIFTAFECVDNE